MSAHVCEIFGNLYMQLPDGDDEVNLGNGASLLYESYCPTNNGQHGTCNTDYDKIGAGFGYLLTQLFNNVESEEEHENQKGNYVHYGLMWISYKLQQLNEKNSQSIGLNDFFSNYIINGEWYDDIEEYVEPKMFLLNNDINIEHMSDIYKIFKQMCKIFSNDADDIDDLDFTGYYESVKSCGENILKKNSNYGGNDTRDSHCRALYDMLEHVYNDFKKDYVEVMGPQTNELPEIPKIEEIKEIIESKLDESDSQDDVPNSEHINSTNDLEPQQNEETTEDPTNNILLDGFAVPYYEITTPDYEITVPDYEFTITNYKPHDFLDGVEVPDIEIDAEIVFDGIELPDTEAEYPDAQDDFFYIDADLSFFEDKYAYLENDPQNIVDALFVSENSIPNIVDELYVPEDDLSYPMVKPKIIDFEWPDLNIEQNDSDNQPQPHQINTLKFDDPFKHPENFSDSIMCKLHGPKSVYCNRIICNRIKIGVIALSIPIVLVFIYKYFPWKRTKKPKKTKKMKKVINLLDRKKTKKIDIHSIDDKKTIQTIINSNDKKKTPKRIINSNDKEKTRKRIINSNDKGKTRKRIINYNDKEKTTLLFNIYKQMRLSPMPFIHLFMLLILFIFKRKKNSIE
ncbi:CIR protein [Plasmodium chabaudi chabaudi]|uniref:CIR protein n=1 Tax=Plasmodium chabaudi chabaudi TaxID=31271 RepID=A0A4V0K430_PLACU|nr:CIR protein [Plasmodium chabaudi chabaudi]VTZ67607.1 CIR protein [Plasmodium chabaudi chabaudi]|eukprot:XP_016653372.1 CIR protein [Plasmodium chabaudi chabaudi]